MLLAAGRGGTRGSSSCFISSATLEGAIRILGIEMIRLYRRESSRSTRFVMRSLKDYNYRRSNSALLSLGIYGVTTVLS